MIRAIIAAFWLSFSTLSFSAEELLIPDVDFDSQWVAGSIMDLLSYDMKIVLRHDADSEKIQRTFAILGNKIIQPIGFYTVDVEKNPEDWGYIQRKLGCVINTKNSNTTILISSNTLTKCHVVGVSSATELTDLIGIIVGNFDHSCGLDIELNKENFMRRVRKLTPALSARGDVDDIFEIVVDYAFELAERNICTGTPGKRLIR